MKQEEQCRAEFEAWCRNNDYADYLQEDGRYKTAVARSAWLAWQAAYSRRPSPAPLSDEEIIAADISSGARLGDSLAILLDEDQFNNVEPRIFELCRAIAVRISDENATALRWCYENLSWHESIQAPKFFDEWCSEIVAMSIVEKQP